MGKRRIAREYTLKILYQLEITQYDPEKVLRDFWEIVKAPDDVVEFTQMLVNGTVKNKASIDEILRKYSKNWLLERMSVVDRNILRFAVFELIYIADIPENVTINESLEIAKRFSSEDSSLFVNGVLDQIRKEELGDSS